MFYKCGGVWWNEFVFCRQRIRESTKTNSKTLAKDAERKRHRKMEEGLLDTRKRMARSFSIVAQEWLAIKRPRRAGRP